MTRYIVSSFLLLMALPVFAQTWQQKYDLYKNQMSRTSEGALVQELKNYHVIFVTGILAESTYEDSERQIHATLMFGEYFQEVISWLEAHGISVERVKLESEESPAFNAQVIRRAIHNAKLPVVLYTHSKGGVDMLEALKQEPGITSKIRAWIASQSPLWGSSIAEILFQDIFPRWLVEPIINTFFGGSYEGAYSLTRTRRRDAMQSPEYQALFEGPLRKIPKLTFSSYGRQPGLGPSNFLDPLRAIMERREGPNDGVVSLTGSYLPHSVQVVEGGVDHIASVVDCYWFTRNGKLSEKLQACKYDRLAHTRALLKLSLEIQAK